MDAAFPTAAYPSMTIGDLRDRRAHGTANAVQLTELARREAVEAGDMTRATPGERLRAVRAAPKPGDLRVIPSGMGGVFDVKLLAKSPNGTWQVRVDMPRNPDWHAYLIDGVREDVMRLPTAKVAA